MKASEIANQANNLTDESYDYQTLLGFINDGIAEVNVELNAVFPFCTSQDEEPPFHENWQRLVLVPFVAAKIKQKDSSQFEYMDLFGQFREGLMKMKAKCVVPDEYKSTELTDSYSPDYTTHYNNW